MLCCERKQKREERRRKISEENMANPGSSRGLTREEVLEIIAERPSRKMKCPELNSTSPNDWREFKESFRVFLKEGPAMSVQSQKNWLYRATSGMARRTIASINHDEILDIEELIRRYEKRFIPEAGTTFARKEFNDARQLPDESILEFHGRLRGLFMDAYPDTTNTERSGQLIESFAEKLIGDELTQAILDNNPTNYSDALTAAQRLSATRRAAQATKAKDNPRLLAATTHAEPGAGAAPCGWCGRRNHQIYDCWQMMAVRDRERNRRARGHGSFRGLSPQVRRPLDRFRAPPPAGNRQTFNWRSRGNSTYQPGRGGGSYRPGRGGNAGQPANRQLHQLQFAGETQEEPTTGATPEESGN